MLAVLHTRAAKFNPFHTHLCCLSWVNYAKNPTKRQDAILSRNAMLERCMLSSCVCLSVRPSVRHKPVLYQNDWTGFWQWGFLPPTVSYTVFQRNSGISKISVFICFKLGNWKLSSRQIGCVVSRTRWLWSLLITLATVDASWLDSCSLLHVRRWVQL